MLHCALSRVIVIKCILLLQESFITNAKLTEGEIIKNAKYVETLFKPAVNKAICRWDLCIVSQLTTFLSVTICRESEQSVLSCYESNPGKPLLCRDKVLAFTKCVSEARAGLVTPGGWGQSHPERQRSVLHTSSLLSPSLVIVNYSDSIIYYGDSLVTSSFLKPAQYHEVKQGDYFKFISELKVTKPLSVVIVEC